MKKVWVFWNRNDEYCEHGIELYTSKRKACRRVREWAEQMTGKKWRSLHEGSETAKGYVTKKETDYIELEADFWIKSAGAYLEVVE